MQSTACSQLLAKLKDLCQEARAIRKEHSSMFPTPEGHLPSIQAEIHHLSLAVSTICVETKPNVVNVHAREGFLADTMGGFANKVG